MKTRKPLPPRNHVVVALIKRNAGNGVHGKTFKAQRRQDKIEINGMVAKRPGTRLLTGYTASSILPRPTNFRQSKQSLKRTFRLTDV